MPYRVELAPNRRAGCLSAECKDAKIKFEKGEFRFGVWVTIMEHQNWQWKHWGCITPKIIENINNETDHDASQIDGMEDVGEEWAAKFQKALDEGHVPDEDWKGDVEQNRPGAKGKRVTPKKKQASEDEEVRPLYVNVDCDLTIIPQENDDAAATPTKATSKKRKQAKKADTEDALDDEEAPAPKKAKAKAKPKKTAKQADDEEDDKPIKKTKAKPKKAAEQADDEEDDKPLKKAEAKKTAKTPTTVIESDDEEEVTKTAPKKKAASKKVVKPDAEDSARDQEHVPTVKKAKKGGRKK